VRRLSDRRPSSHPTFEERVVGRAGNCVKGEFELVGGCEDSLIIGPCWTSQRDPSPKSYQW
jgi:hypothetical protein